MPALIPVDGSAPGRLLPLTMTLFGTKVVPGGIGSARITAAPKLPVLVMPDV
ncbi:hypothetical protein D3C75_1287180 [compost metagenome]